LAKIQKIFHTDVNKGITFENKVLKFMNENLSDSELKVLNDRKNVGHFSKIEIFSNLTEQLGMKKIVAFRS
jgi:hypothetical protein